MNKKEFFRAECLKKYAHAFLEAFIDKKLFIIFSTTKIGFIFALAIYALK